MSRGNEVVRRQAGGAGEDVQGGRVCQSKGLNITYV